MSDDNGANVSQAPRKLQVWLFNPFEYVAGLPALALGVAAILTSGLLGAVSRSHFDGVLDFHTGLAVPLWFYPLEGLVDWLALALVLYPAGLLLSGSRIRAIDVFGTQALARFPTLFMAAAALLPGYQTLTERLATTLGRGSASFDFSAAEIAVFIAVIVVVLLAVVWMCVLMYRAFAVACNVRGAKAIVAFIVSLLVAEVLSKVAIMGLFTYAPT